MKYFTGGAVIYGFA